MYAAIRRYRIKNTGDIDEIVRRAQEGFVPLIKQAQGFVAYHLINAGNNTVVTFSLFQDRAGAEESTRLAANWVNQNLAQYVEGAPEVTAGEVLLHEFK
ncbi:MAG TPA: hypothetical protein VFQ30_02295 [Ktedonobacteraceae bacterium]|nr:hypothetical protein [Ktedonobacteraceae bacterium]